MTSATTFTSKTTRIMTRLALGASLMAGVVGIASAGAVEDLQNFNREYKSASGNFSQVVKGKGSKSSSGSFVFSRPGKFRWEYNSPYQQTLVSDGRTLSIFDKDLNKTTKRALGSAIGSSPAAVLFGSGDLSKNFSLTNAGDRDGRNWVHAKPKARSNFSSVNIGMRNGVPEAVVLYDNFGQTTILFLSNMQKNPGISAGSFKL